MDPVVNVSKVSKSFIAGDTRSPVLHDIDLTVNRGETKFITGPSGCGKTTLISIIAGILTPDSGTVSIFGENVVFGSGRSSALRLANIGFIFQQHNLVPTLTAAENVSIPLLIKGTEQLKARKRALSMLNEVGLGDRADHRPNQLSGGQQQRVAIARALVSEPKLIICDEPTASLDAENGLHVMQFLKELTHARQTTVVVVTHDSRIFHFADSITALEDGRVISTVATSLKQMEPVT
jgi:putative ABC transport system ATP-binding protein